MGRVCPACGRAIPRGAIHRCPMAARPGRDREREAARRDREGWRGGYGGRGYRDAREAALERSRGLCEACGATVFERSERGWRKVARDYGATHHVVPLSRGGANEASNVVVLCARCHGLAHSAANRDVASAGELIKRLWTAMGRLR